MPFLNRSVGSSQARPPIVMSPMPRPSSVARGPGAGAVGLGMPHEAATKGTAPLIEKRLVNVRLTEMSAACCMLTT